MCKQGAVLLVEPDSNAARQLLATLLSNDYTVDVCESFTEAVSRVKLARFDCVVLDVMLPEIPGYSAVPILKTIDPGIAIIMTTGANSKELEAKVRKQDIYYYHLRSIENEELRLAVQGLFARKRKEKEGKAMHTPASILIVDDDPVFVKAIGAVLESNGYQINSAGSKDEAMEKITRDRPDLIILDIMMDKMTDGFEMCYKLKHDPELKSIPILSMSAITQETGFTFSPKTDGEYFEADDYLEKPAKPDQVLKRVRRLLG